MFSALLRRVAGIFGPGGILLLLLLWFFSLPGAIYWLPVIRMAAPVIVGGLVVFIALRFGLWRLFYGAVLLAMALLWVVLNSGGAFYPALFFLLCLDFMVFSLMPSRKVVAIDTAVRIGLLSAQFPLLAFFIGSDAAIMVTIRRELSGAVLSSAIPAVGGLSLFVLFFFWRTLRRDDVQVAGFFWVTVAMIISLEYEKKLVMPEYVLYLIGPVLLFAVCLESAYDLAFRDRLTGLAARRAMDDFLRRLRPPCVVAMVDIDFFKKFNDKFGHDVGDQVLAKVAAVISTVGGGGRPFRYGGEEFAIVFPGGGCDKVEPRLEHLRQRVEDHGFTIRGVRKNGAARGRIRGGGRKVGLTVSIGLAGAGRGETVAAAMKKADQALYRAKNQGRNRVCRT